MRICVVAYYCTYAGAAQLARALHRFTSHSVQLVYKRPDRYGFHMLHPAVAWDDDPEGVVDAVQRADVLLFAGTPSVWKFFERFIYYHPHAAFGSDPYAWLAKRQTATFVTDSWFYEDPPRYNRMLQDTGGVVFMMPDLEPYYEGLIPPVPYYQPVETPKVPKADRLTICHSPGGKADSDLKGSRAVARVIGQLREEHTFDYQVLSGLSHAQCLQAKGRAHLFIDQMVDRPAGDGFPRYRGGLGKSGLEAMRMGCVVVTSGDPPDLPGALADPPVAWVRGAAELYRCLAHVLPLWGTERWREMYKESYAWAKQYTDPEWVARHVVEHLPCGT